MVKKTERRDVRSSDTITGGIEQGTSAATPSHLKLRLGPPLRGKLEKAAQRQRKSLTSEILDRLERSFDLFDQLERIRIADAANKMLRNLTVVQRALIQRDMKDASLAISDCTEDLVRIIEAATRKREDSK